MINGGWRLTLARGHFGVATPQSSFCRWPFLRRLYDAAVILHLGVDSALAEHRDVHGTRDIEQVVRFSQQHDCIVFKICHKVMV